MSTVRSFLPAFGAALALTFVPSGDKIAFQPKEGSTVTKTFDISGDFALDEMSLIVNGQDVGGMLGQIEMSMKQETHYEVTDTYEKVADGRPTSLLRTFDRLHAQMSMDMSPAQAELPEMNSASSLEGKTVAFRWNPDEGAYDRSFKEGEGDESLLEGLEENMDLRVFLPTEEVSADDSWTVELKELVSVTAPGGNMSMAPEGMDIDQDSIKMFEEMFGDFGKEFGDLLEGECKCTYRGMIEEGEAHLAEIAIEVEVSATVDLTELLNKVIHKALDESGVDAEVDFSLDTADLSIDFEGSGTLLWNPAAGRFHSFQLGGDATFGFDLAVGVEAEGESQKLDASLELSGSLRNEASVEE